MEIFDRLFRRKPVPVLKHHKEYIEKIVPDLYNREIGRRVIETQIRTKEYILPFMDGCYSRDPGDISRAIQATTQEAMALRRGRAVVIPDYQFFLRGLIGKQNTDGRCRRCTHITAIPGIKIGDPNCPVIISRCELTINGDK